jgi:hypothetical protein
MPMIIEHGVALHAIFWFLFYRSRGVADARPFYTLVFIESDLAAMVGVRGGLLVGISWVKPPGSGQ